MPEVGSKQVSQEPSSALNSDNAEAYPDPKASHQKVNGYSAPSSVKSYAAAAKSLAVRPPEEKKSREVPVNPPVKVKQKHPKAVSVNPNQPVLEKADVDKESKSSPISKDKEITSSVAVSEKVVSQIPPPAAVKSFAAVAKNGIAAGAVISTQLPTTNNNLKPPSESVKIAAVEYQARPPHQNQAVTSRTDNHEHVHSEIQSIGSKVEDFQPEPVAPGLTENLNDRCEVVQKSEMIVDKEVKKKESNSVTKSGPSPSLTETPVFVPATSHELTTLATSGNPSITENASFSAQKLSSFAVNAPEFVPSFQKLVLKSSDKFTSPTSFIDSSGISSATSSLSNGYHDAPETPHADNTSPSDWSHPRYSESKNVDDGFNKHFSEQLSFRPAFQSQDHFASTQAMPFYPVAPTYTASSAQFFHAPITTEINTRNGPLLVNPLVYPIYNNILDGNGLLNGHNGDYKNVEFDYSPNAQSPPCVISPVPSVIKSFYFSTSCTVMIVGRNGTGLNDLRHRDNVEIWIDEDDNISRRQGFSMLHIHGFEHNVDSCAEHIRRRLDVRDETLQAVSAIQSPEILRPPIMKLDLPEGTVLQAFVSSVEKDGVIFLQLPGHPSFVKLTGLEDHLNRYCANPDTPFIDHRRTSLDTGCFVAAPVHPDANTERWIRAKVISRANGNGQVQLRSLDHGWLFSSSLTSLKPLAPEFCMLPIQAIESRVLLGRFDSQRPLQDQINRNVDSAIGMEWVKVRAVIKEYNTRPVVEMWLPSALPQHVSF